MSDKSERAQKPAVAETRAGKEERILQFWKDNEIFEKSLEKKAPKGEFVFYDGPPFATGLPHYGHILPGTIKDVIPRYKTMQGYRVPRRWGWDCHGLPIENLIEKELGLETKKDIEKFGIAEFNKRAKESVLTYEKDWKEIIPRTGRWVDMDNAYKTMDKSYTESVWWSFKELYDKGLVYQGFKSMHLCPRCETTLSNFEVNQGYKDIVDISVVAKFEVIGRPNTYILVWTTTPWTLPGNAALAINPSVEYVEVEGENGEVYILAESRAVKYFTENFKIIRKISGRELVNTKYKTLFDYYIKEGQVYYAGFVTAEEGTGVVHIAPAFGEDDYNLSQKEKIQFIQHVGTDGRFKPEVTDFALKSVKPKDDPSNPSGQAHQSGDVEIIKYLAAKNLLFAKEKITHSYPHCWRCDTPLLNYASSSWFVKVTEIKDKLLSNNKKVKWLPEDIRDGRFGKWLEGARDWAVSRSRFWGTPLPVWQNADSSKRMIIDSVDSLKKYTKSNGNTFFVMRHGETQHNIEKVWDLNPDKHTPLTEHGESVVKEKAKSLKGRDIDLIIASPYYRAKETAELVAEQIGYKDKIENDDRLVEWNAGTDFDGASLEKFFELRRQSRDRHNFKAPGGESYAEVVKRAGEFLYELEQKHKGKKILIVTHGAVSRALSVIGQGDFYATPSGTKKARDFKNGEIEELSFVPLPHNDNFELDLHRPSIDSVVLEKDGEEYRRVPEVFDTWYDSGSVPFASRGGKDFRPADFIAEGLDQTRGWFYTMAVLGAALFGHSPYKQVVVNGLILAEDGKKMSKRLKNYPELTDILDKYGADALRYYLMSSPAVRGEDLAFSEKGLDEVMKKNINRLENVLSFYELYVKESGIKIEGSSEHVLDLWIDEKLNELREAVTNGLESYELDKASRPLADFIEDLSTWYLRRSRTRPEALPKLREVLVEFAKLSAPFTPFMAEDMYQRLRMPTDPESVHLTEWPETKKSLFSFFKSKDNQMLKDMEETRRLVSLALEARSKANIKVRQPLQKLEIKNSKLTEDYLDIIKDELNVKEVVMNQSLATEVALDTSLTIELIEEGKVRDAIRLVQDWRKEQGLKPGEKATYVVSAENEAFFARNTAEIKRATNVEF